MNYDRDIFATNVKKAREKKDDMTMTKLAALIKVSIPTIHDLEKSRRTPKIDTVCRLAVALEVSIEWLLTEH